MKRKATKAVLTAARTAGLFALARRLTAHDLRILCYHGAALRDEHRFRPALFMSEATFSQRIRSLERQAYPVLERDGFRLQRILRL
jgi:hypothetical protein